MTSIAKSKPWSIIKEKYDSKGLECWSYRRDLIDDIVKICQNIEALDDEEFNPYSEDYLNLQAMLDEKLTWFEGEQYLVGLSYTQSRWERLQLANRLKKKFSLAMVLYNRKGKLDGWVTNNKVTNNKVKE